MNAFSQSNNKCIKIHRKENMCKTTYFVVCQQGSCIPITSNIFQLAPREEKLIKEYITFDSGEYSIL